MEGPLPHFRALQYASALSAAEKGEKRAPQGREDLLLPENISRRA